MDRRIVRRVLSWLCVLCLVLSLIPPSLAAHQGVRVWVDGKLLESDVAPFAIDGTTYVPLTFFSEVMGTGRGQWVDGTAQVRSAQISITAVPGESWIEANDRCLPLPGKVLAVSGRTMVPLRTLALIYGASAVWDWARGAVVTSGGGTPLTSGEDQYGQEDLYWLSRVISAESRGEPLEGQIAVGNVVLNRVKSSQYPNTIKDVVFDTNYGVQFEPVSNGTIYQEPTASSVRAAKLCLEGANTVGDCLYFFAPALSAGTWIVNNCTYYTTIGCHRFYL